MMMSMKQLMLGMRGFINMEIKDDIVTMPAQEFVDTMHDYFNCGFKAGKRRLMEQIEDFTNWCLVKNYICFERIGKTPNEMVNEYMKSTWRNK